MKDLTVEQALHKIIRAEWEAAVDKVSCNSRHGQFGFDCCRVKDHEGPHVAATTNEGEIVDCWED